MTEPIKRHSDSREEGPDRTSDLSAGEESTASELSVSTADEGQEYGSEGGDLAGELERLRAERDEYKDKYLRAQAECSNISKRMSQQHAEALRYGTANLARALLPVIDNFRRTFESFPQSQRENPIAKGVALIAEQFEKALRDYGILRVESVGQPFDPARHEALMQEVSAEHPAGTVSRELEAGYRIHERILRPAKVAVSKGADGGPQDELPEINHAHL